MKKTVTQIINNKTITMSFNPEGNKQYSMYSMSIDGQPKFSWGQGDTSCLNVINGKTLISNEFKSLLKGLV